MNMRGIKNLFAKKDWISLSFQKILPFGKALRPRIFLSRHPLSILKKNQTWLDNPANSSAKFIIYYSTNMNDFISTQITKYEYCQNPNPNTT